MILTTEQKNIVLDSMIHFIESARTELLECNKQELIDFATLDKALYDRLKLSDAKVDEMIQSLRDVHQKDDPIGKLIYSFDNPNGMTIQNKTSAFGTVLIIYESRPDVTVEAAAIAFKSGNKILLKGGKESKKSNLILVECWHKALQANKIPVDWIHYLDYNREKTQEFLKQPSERIDLIVPRGGEKLIDFVKQHANCPVLVSGRGNNFLYVHKDADWEKAKNIIINAKVDKISACNALDKVLINTEIDDFENKVNSIIKLLQEKNVKVYCNIATNNSISTDKWNSEDIMYEEFLDYKILIDSVEAEDQAVASINKYSGGHSTAIITEDKELAERFMSSVDSAAVYHNASTRFTDGGQMGLGAELAISTDKLHHRGPLGLDQLVTNKWYVYGNGQIR